MRRVVVIGAGFFGGLVARGLRERGITPLVASRSGADLRIDVDDIASLRAALRERDVVVDTAGPWQARRTTLPEAAIERRFDLVDLSESLGWAERLLALAPRAEDAGVRILPSCSAVAAVAAACVRMSAIAGPREVDLFLAPASAETASPATIASFVASLGRPIRTRRDGRLLTLAGFTQTRAFPSSPRRGGIVEASAALLLPLAWPSIARAEMWVDPNVPLGRAALTLAARIPPLAALVRAVAPRVDVRWKGRHDGLFAVTTRAGDHEHTITLSAPRGSYRIATEPAVLAAESLARGDALPAGLVLPPSQVAHEALLARLRDVGIEVRA